MVRSPACIAILLFLISSCRQDTKQANPVSIQVKAFHKVAFLLYDNFDTALLHCAIREVESFYGCKTMVLDPGPLPASAFYQPRQRYKADSLISYQGRLLPPGTDAVIGLTQKDISTTLGDKQDWGIFGLGYLPGKACIISVFRLRATTYDQYQERFIKVLLHELGHNQGLPHCSYDSTCFMADARGTIAQVDKEQKELCSHCHKLLGR